jgi:hypothetical protein
MVETSYLSSSEVICGVSIYVQCSDCLILHVHCSVISKINCNSCSKNAPGPKVAHLCGSINGAVRDPWVVHDHSPLWISAVH